VRNGCFVSGTDTGVGKTVLSALLTAALDGIYWKPIQSGASQGTDRVAVMQWAELPEERTLPECYCFGAPVSPHLAAELAGARIDLKRVVAPAHLTGRPLITEGAGGVLVPLNETQTILDLILHLRLPVVVASRTALGTINHTLLTLRALAGTEVLGVVMVGEENIENRRAIERYGGVEVIGLIPVLESIRRDVLLGVFASRFNRRRFSDLMLPASNKEPCAANPKS
jgi:dethiobiotin synthetase